MEERIKTMLPLLNEYQKRIFLASEAIAYGWGGIQKVSEISGASMNTIRKGIAEIEGNEELRKERIRKEGGGRKSLTEKYPRIKERILAIVDPKTYGNPERVLPYTTLGVRTVRDLLEKIYGERISFRSVCSLLDEWNTAVRQTRSCYRLEARVPTVTRSLNISMRKSRRF